MFSKSCVATCAAIVASGAAFGLGSGTAVAAPYTNAATVTVDTSSVAAGAAIIVHLNHFTASEHVSLDLHSRVVHLLDVNVIHGSSDISATIPAKVECGSHEIVATGDAHDVAFADISVVGDCTSVGPAGPANSVNGGNFGDGNNGSGNGTGSGNNGNANGDGNGNSGTGNGNTGNGNVNVAAGAECCATKPGAPAPKPTSVTAQDTAPNFQDSAAKLAGLGLFGVAGATLLGWRRRRGHG